MNNLPIGWLSKSGELIECSAYDHVKIAEEITKKYNYKIPIDRRMAYDDILIDNGWVHIGKSEISYKYVIWWKNFLSEEQKTILSKYFEDETLVEKLILQKFRMELGES